MQASKNGFFYVLDRQTGEFISGTPFVSGITWATGLDPKTGRPIESPTAYDGLKPVIVSPDPGGAHNWNPIAFNPTTGLVYLAAKNGTHGLHAPDAQWKYNPKNANLGADARYEGPLIKQLISLPPPKGELLAWDPVRQRAAWRAPYPVVEGGGVLTTAANLVFQGRADGILAAYRATDGKQVWQFDAGTGIMAPPITYSVDGVQYVSVMAGWGGPTATFNAPNQGKIEAGIWTYADICARRQSHAATARLWANRAPTPAITLNASPEVIHEGQLLYTANCAQCHGLASWPVHFPICGTPRVRCTSSSRRSCWAVHARHSACRHSRIS